MISVCRITAITIVLAWYFLGLQAQADSNIPPKNTQKQWTASVAVEFNTWSLDGTLVNRTDLYNGDFGSFLATGDSMNVKKETIPTFNINLNRNAWTLGLYYLPIEFSGLGTAKAQIDTTLNGSQAGAYITVPLKSNFDINVILGKLSYDLIRTPNSVFGLGAGIGELDVNIDLLATGLDSWDYIEKEPFGFLNLHMSNRYGAFFYGFSVNAIKVDIENIEESFSDYKVDLGYRIIDKHVQWDISAGFRRMDIDLTLSNAQDETSLQLGIKGPYLGLRASF